MACLEKQVALPGGNNIARALKPAAGAVGYQGPKELSVCALRNGTALSVSTNH